MAHVRASSAPGNPRALSDLLADATDRAQRIARRVASLILGASAVIDQVRVRRISLTAYELDGATVADITEVVAEVCYLATERLALDEAPITLEGQRLEAGRVARVAAGRMLLGYSAQGRYELGVAGGHIVAHWYGTGSRGQALKMFAASLSMRHLTGEVVGGLVRVSGPAQLEVA
jgi:hypothetical protein